MKRRLLRLLERTGLIGPAFRAWESTQALLATRGPRVDADDALPVPPPQLIVRVAGTADVDWFLEGGRLGAASVRGALQRQGVALDGLRAMLDFGCGCGRVTRNWAGLSGVEVAGTDLSRPAVDWCRRNLPFARFEENGLEPPLVFDEESFDLVYALSVFTHLTADLQLAWRDELRRLLRPGGFLLVTTHGRSYLPRLERDERDVFERGELVVRWGDVAGTNLCSAYHPERYLRETFAQGFAFLELEAEGAHGNPTQDLVLLRKVSA
ncbi:MAG TPA: class I SAM-dependent methyltransferase [Gaiellaceae bacterium]|nr:class I SAM-dependent methyltransferase [Gaiellaceae bacterium]